jgi:PAS domain S-box-containing protein
MKQMDDALSTALLWSVSVIPLMLLTAALGYLHYKDKEKRKLMFALALGVSCVGYLYKMLEGFGGLNVIESSFQWASLPILSAVTIASLSSLLKLRDFDKPFKLFLFPLGISIFLLVTSIHEKNVYIALCGILSTLSFIALTKLVTTKRERSDFMFLVALLFFMFSGIGLGMDLAPEFTVLASFLGVWFAAVMLATSKKSSEESMASFFVMKKEIASAKKKFNILFNLMPDPAAIVDGKGNFLEVSDRVKEIFGYEKKELLGKNFFETNAVTTSMKAILAKNLADRMMGLRIAPYEVEVLSKDGRKLLLELNAARIEYGSDQADLVVIRDRTERKKMEQALLESEEKLARTRAVGELATIVAHDLRNPLQGISNAIHYLNRKLNQKMDKDERAMLELIKNHVKYSDKILNDLLDYSRDMRLGLTEIAPKSIVEESLSLVTIPENIQVTNEIPDELTMGIDLEKMKIVFVNIIRNAIDAMPEGGTLTIGSKESTGSIELTFKDTGVGMPKETLEKLFTPLFTTKAKGMGFGLAICKRIIEAHRGEISVESAMGKGTTFIATFPIEQKSEENKTVCINVPDSLPLKATKAQ